MSKPKGLSSERLLSATDQFVLKLLKQAGGGMLELPDGGVARDHSTQPTTPRVPSLEEQVDVLGSVTKYLAVKHKISPDPEEQNDWVSRARDSLGGGAPSSDSPPSKRRSRRAPTPPAGAESRDGADTEQFGRPGTPAAVSLPNGSTGPTSSEA